MPIGSKHDVTGLLLREGRFIILRLEDGGRWRLDLDPGAEQWLGRRVRLFGIRSGFDLLDVQRIELA